MDLDNLSKKQLAVAIKIADRAKELGIDPDLALAIAWKESSFNANAIGPKTDYGHAIGPMQVMESNAKNLGLHPAQLHDVDTNINAGLRILKENLERYKGNERAALVAYNSRPVKAEEYLSKNEDESAIPPETQKYLREIHKLRPIGLQTVSDQAPQNIFGAPVNPGELFGKPPATAPATANKPPEASAGAPANEGEPATFGEPGTPGFNLNESTSTPKAERPNLEGMGQSYRKARGVIANESEDIPSGLIAAGGAGAGALLGRGQSKQLSAASDRVLNAKAAYDAQRASLDALRATAPAAANTAALQAELAQRMQAVQDLEQKVKTAQQEYDALRGASQVVAEGTMEGAKDAATTGRQRQGYNVATSQQAKRTDLAEDIMGKLKRTGAIAADAPNPLATFPDVSATRSGIIVPKAVQAAEEAATAPKLASLGTTLADLKQQEAEARAAAKQTTGAISAAEGEASKAAKKFGDTMTSKQASLAGAEARLKAMQDASGGSGVGGKAMRALTGKIPGALSGAGAAFNATEALNRYEKGDTSGAVRSAVSAVFDIMSMAPPGTPVTAAIKALGITGGLAMQVYDYFASQKKETPAPQPQPSRGQSPLASQRQMTKDQYGRYHLT